MDDKVQKLLQRAINENLSPDRVSYIMQFNGYDQSAIDLALDELSKKKRPVLFQRQYDSSDTPSPSQQVGPPKPSNQESVSVDQDVELPETTPVAPSEPMTFDQGTGGVESTANGEESVSVSTADWWGDKWNGLVEGVSDFMYHFEKEQGNTQEQIAEFVELSKEKYPDLYNSYQQNLQSEDLRSLGYDSERIKREAAGQAYIDFWQTNPEIENEVVPFIREKRREQDVENIGVKIDEAVTKELDSRFLSGAVKGLASSLPAMATAGATMGGSFMTTSYYAADEDLKRTFAENPDLQMTRGQQEAYKLTVAGVEGVLEKIGLSGALKGTSMVKSVLAKKVFSRLADMGEDVGSEAFERIVKQEAKGLKGYLKKTAQGTLSEAETGALQQLSVDLINETVNGLSGKEVFTPKSAMTIIQDAIYAGAQEAVGGGIISGTVGSFSNEIVTQEDFDKAEEFIGRIEVSKLEENLDKRVAQGKITEAEKGNILNSAKEFKKTLAKVPDDVDQESKRKIYQLINEKMKVNQKAAGKDDAIQAKAKERVASINEEIANLYEVKTQQQAAPQPTVSTETEVEPRFFAPTISKDTNGNAVVDPGKVKEETFTGASVVSKGHVDEDTAFSINSALSLLGDKAKDMKVRVFDSVESLLNADQGAANFYVQNNKIPKAYIKGNEMFVLTKNAVEQYNKARGTNVEYAKQYIHEVGHPIVSSLVAEDPASQTRLFEEIKEAAEAGDAVAQRALQFGSNYSVQGQAKIENETVVEFLALVTDKKRFKSLNRSTKQKIIDFFNSLLNSISSEVVITTDAQLYDIARDMRDAYRMQKGIKIQPTTNKQYQQRSTEFSVDEGTTPGNRLFNQPLPEALAIAQGYMQEKGMDYDPGKTFNTLDTDISQEIAAAYDAMEHEPKNPDVKKAYEAMITETVDQYDAIVAEGYVVEINNNEPYSSSKEMIEDLAANKRMKIFSTESGFGEAAITDDQRAENPLLRDSGYTDTNGQTLLVNDLFRFVHDFFGHAKRGNSFGPKGEENAWDAHSRMYTKEARRAMTSETRGQNSWVNFSGVNEDAFKLRDKARRLRKEGRTDEASKLVQEVYEMMSFAEQKIGLLPDKYVRNEYMKEDPEFSLDEGQIAYGAAPYRAMYVESINEAKDKFNDKGLNEMISGFKSVVEAFGGKVVGIEKSIGGWFDSEIKKLTREISFRPIIEGLSDEDLNVVAAITGKKLAKEQQDGIMIVKANPDAISLEMEFTATSKKAAEEIMMNLKDFGVYGFTLTPKNNTFVVAAFDGESIAALENAVNNNIKEGRIDERSVKHSKADISFPSMGEYGEILEAYKLKRRDDGEIRQDILDLIQETLDAPSFSIDETVKIREGVDVRFSNVNPNFRKKREIVYAERVLSENKMFEFTGREKITSADDVAFLFRNMEDASSENAFVVFHNSEGKYKTVWINTGDSTSVAVGIPRILAAYENATEDLGTDNIKMTFVHNHPSGKLRPSEADYRFVESMKKKFESTNVQIQNSIIINLDSGEYTTFNPDNRSNTELRQQGEARPTDVPAQVFSFSKQQLYTKSNSLTPVLGPESIARMLSKFKRGINEKGGYFVLDNANNVRYAAVLEVTGLPDYSSQSSGVVRDLQRYGNNVIFFGTSLGYLKGLFNSTKALLASVDPSNEFSVLDIVHIKDSENFITSSRESGKDMNIRPSFDTQMIDFSLDEVKGTPRLDDEVQGDEGEVGTIDIPDFSVDESIVVIDTPKSSEDSRSFVKEFVTDIDIRELQGRRFVTNMYDYSTAGAVNFPNGLSINLFGGRNYVPFMLERNGKKLGESSNLAAFNSEEQAEGFIRNATQGGADLFAPHSGTLSESWQFQHHIFEQLVDLVLDNKIMSKSGLIDVFNSALKSNAGKEALQKFNKNNNSKLTTLSSFKKDPLSLVRLLDANNNKSPDLRKALNKKIAANKDFQKAVGIKNLQEFYNHIADPLNVGISGGEIMSFVEFDPSTFEIIKTNPGDPNHHPSFSWAINAKIKRILHPNKYYKSYDLTKEYTKYNKEKTVQSIKAEVGMKEFIKSNVSSSSGAIAKVAVVEPTDFSTDEGYVKSLSLKPLYHGSNKKFDKFDMSKAGATDEGFLGRAVYLTAEYENAENYGPEVNTFYAKIKNPLVIDDPYSFGGVNPNKIREILGLSKDASVSKVTKELKKRGYDAVVVNEIEGTDAIEVAVLDPKIISNEPAFSTDEGINWYESPEGKGDPAISRRDVLLEEAAQDLKAGRLKNYEFREMAKGLSPIEKISRFFAPATTERMESALAKNKRPSLNKVVKNGTVVALRLDIPAYTGSNTWVVSIHDGKKRDGKVISYRSVARIKDVVFKSNPLAALSIAGGEAKSTIGRMFGKYEGFDGATPEDQAETAKGIVSEIWKSKEWKQIGMNPTRASYFYDRGSGRPVVAAEEVIQIGGLVYAKNPVFTRWNDPAFEVKGYSDVDGAPIYFSADEGEGNINNLRGTLRRVNSAFKTSRERILANPEAYYTKQSLKAIKENLELMTEGELLENMTAEGLNRVSNQSGAGRGENDISILAAVELINRKAEAGEDVSELLVDLAKVGTTVGRMLRHFAELKSATPLGIVATVEGALAKANRIMSSTQVERLTDIADRFIKAGQVVKDLRDEIESEYSKETEAKLIKASKDLDKVTRELNKFTSLIVPKKTMSLLSTTIQGNLLTPISQITNVGANLFQIATSIPVRGFETLFSKITSKFTGGTKRSFKYSLMAVPFALKRGGIGVAEAIETIIRGGASTDKIIHTGFLPGAAFLAALSDTKFASMVNKTLGKEAIKGDVLPQMANGKINPADRIKALYEGVFGVAPEIMFRFLALGDKPFSRFSEGMETYQQAARLGLKGDALKNYIKYPNKKQQKAIEEAGRRLTFQDDSIIATGFFGATNWLERQGPIGGAVAFTFKLTMPYVKTPANIFVETLKFAVPGIGMASAIRNFQKKKFDEGASDLAKAATGQMLVMAANALIANALVSGAFGEEDEEERSLKYLKFPPMSINKSGLARLMRGEDPEYRDGDVFMRYDKFGIVGMVIGARVTSIKNNLVEAKGEAEGYYVGDNDKGFFEPFNRVFDELGVGLGTIQFLNSQSFLTGVNGLLGVFSGEATEYDTDRWFENTFRSVTAIPLPNTLSALHRSIREYMPNLRTNSVENKFRYILMDRLFNTDGVPVKIDMLGNKIPQTPEGANKWIFNLMDFTKTQDSRDQFILNEIYRLYELQEEADLIPGFPTKIQKIPTKHPETGAKITGWNPETEEEYRNGLQEIQEVYGKNRAEILERLFRSDSYQTLTNERKQERVIETLQSYDRGYKMIKALPGSGMKNIKPPMEWAKMLDKLNDKYFD